MRFDYMVPNSSTGQQIKKTSKAPKRWLLMGLGSFLVALGTLGLFIPFLQGLLLIGLGVGLLSLESPRIRHWWDIIKERFPKLQGKEKATINLNRGMDHD